MAASDLLSYKRVHTTLRDCSSVRQDDFDQMDDYTPIIIGTVVLVVVVTAAVAYLLAQPSDLPFLKRKD